MDKYTLSLKMPGLPPMNSASNLHWRKKRDQKDLWIKEVGVSIGRNRPHEPLQAAHVTITYHGSRLLDADNMYNGC